MRASLFLVLVLNIKLNFITITSELYFKITKKTYSHVRLNIIRRNSMGVWDKKCKISQMVILQKYDAENIF